MSSPATKEFLTQFQCDLRESPQSQFKNSKQKKRVTMEAYIYCADIYCELCGESIRERITLEGNSPDNPEDETTYDSDEFPKGPFIDGGGESDCPQHCASGKDCLQALEIDGEKYGAFLENDLTTEGVRYVTEQLKESPESPIPQLWKKYYSDCGIEFPEDYQENNE